MRKLTHQEILDRQKKKKKQPRFPFVVVLDNIRSLHNVGSIFRTSDGAGVKKLWLCGITGYPPKNEISKTALGAEESVDWEYREDIEKLIQTLKKEGYRIVLLEQTQESIACDQFFPKEPTCLVLGNEIDGISEEIVKYSDSSVEIEMDGLKNSLNVAVAFGILAYQIRTSLKGV